MNLFELSRLNVVSIDNCIGCYDDINHKEKNVFGNKKKFRKFKVTLHVLPENIDYIKCTTPNYDIFALYNKAKQNNKETCWDIKEKIENGKLIYYVRDKTPMKITDIFIELPEYYQYYEAAKNIKNYLSRDDSSKITLGVEHVEPMFNELKSFLGRKFDDCIIWK